MLPNEVESVLLTTCVKSHVRSRERQMGSRLGLVLLSSIYLISHRNYLHVIHTLAACREPCFVSTTMSMRCRPPRRG
jgi:hypothetical protein